jgi:hypothetical protein
LAGVGNEFRKPKPSKRKTNIMSIQNEIQNAAITAALNILADAQVEADICTSFGKWLTFAPTAEESIANPQAPFGHRQVARTVPMI